jgi:hypothetical protein
MSLKPPGPSPMAPVVQLRQDIAKALNLGKPYDGPVTSLEDEDKEASVIVAEGVSLAQFLSMGEQFDSQCARLEWINGDVIARLSTSVEHGATLSAVLRTFSDAGFGGDFLLQTLDSSVFLPGGLGVPQADLSFSPLMRHFIGKVADYFETFFKIIYLNLEY